MPTRFTMSFCIVFTLILMCLIAGPVHADVLFAGSDTVSLSQTNWSNYFMLVKFDPSLGTLQSVNFQLTGYVQGSAGIENLESFPMTIDTYLQTTIVLQDPAGVPMLSAYPSAHDSRMLPAYDGTTDYGGTSGQNVTGFMASDLRQGVLTTPFNDLSAFIGTGNGSLGVYTMDSSYTLGGNRSSQLTTFASATLAVSYTYTPVPEPMTISVMAIGALAIVRRRRK
jgi:hypothetical protein